jgi:Cysteine-rich secretory protein family
MDARKLARSIAAAACLFVGCGAPGPDWSVWAKEPPLPADFVAPTLLIDAARGPTATMDTAAAERYALWLINRDRAAHGLSGVTWDEAAARAGRRHAGDLAHHGITAHVGTDGSRPEQRYTEAGGEDLAFENAACLDDGLTRPLDPAPRFSRAGIERIERAFLAEVPPFDGHRRNLLAARRARVGVGLAQPLGLDIPCLAQELIDDSGDYEPIPRRIRNGEAIRVAGTSRASAAVRAVGIARVALLPPGRPGAVASTFSYEMPTPTTMYMTAGHRTPRILQLDQSRGQFWVEAPLDEGAGLYEISVWALFPGADAMDPVSLRTVIVE